MPLGLKRLIFALEKREGERDYVLGDRDMSEKARWDQFVKKSLECQAKAGDEGKKPPLPVAPRKFPR